jgi:hypothetical protein
MDPKGITQIDDKILVAGNGGTQYQVINIANENAPVYCGGLVFNSGILAVTSVKEADGDAYSYVLTNDSSSEFKIIRGGPGAGPGAGNYPASGTFISQIFDTQNTATALTSLEWSHNQPSGTSIRIQVKSGNTLTELSSNSWVGPNGSSTTYFTSNNGSSIPVTPQGKRYVQFRAELLSSTGGAATPVLQSLNINYQR